MMKRREQLTTKDKTKILTLLSAGVPVYEIQRRFKLKSAESVHRIKRLKVEEV